MSAREFGTPRMRTFSRLVHSPERCTHLLVLGGGNQNLQVPDASVCTLGIKWSRTICRWSHLFYIKLDLNMYLDFLVFSLTCDLYQVLYVFSESAMSKVIRASIAHRTMVHFNRSLWQGHFREQCKCMRF